MRAVIYCRVKEQAQNLSLPTQLRACRNYCDREGYEVAKVFTDAGGIGEDHRPTGIPEAP